MTVDLDALIAEAREIDAVDLHEARNWAEDAESLCLSLADALESTLAELRQERERADEAANHAELALAGRRNAVDALAQEQERAELFKREQVRLAHRCDAAQDALSRAEETIDRIDGEVKNFEQSDNDALCEIERLLTEYDKQKAGLSDD